MDIIEKEKVQFFVILPELGLNSVIFLFLEASEKLEEN
jgi:hypothetical protein